ncbi:hypothetical protein XELAEV_18005125mg [Xenopus laevis]|uniref:Uncharacterized protein n=1 Tax=Xenopus laevis TaxID=8355 RepID=A0A974I2X8_XENLA|nr:hypothetical protein XELAEV_18005125mg [Xenopus laevis]
MAKNKLSVFLSLSLQLSYLATNIDVLPQPSSSNQEPTTSTVYFIFCLVDTSLGNLFSCSHAIMTRDCLKLGLKSFK